MKNIHKIIRDIECSQNWQNEIVKLRESLNSNWNIEDWICLLSCYDFLGMYKEMHSEIIKTEREQYTINQELFALRMFMYGRLNQATGEYCCALNAYAQAASVNPCFKTECLLSLQTGTINYFIGNQKEAHLALNSTAELAEKHGDFFIAAHALDILASITSIQGDWVKAKEFLEKAKKFAESVNNSHRLTWLKFSEAQILYSEGSFEKGLNLMKKVAESFENVRASNSQIYPLVRISEILIEKNKIREAMKMLQKAEEISHYLKYSIIRVRILEGFAKCHSFNKKDDLAKKYLQRAKIMRERAKILIETTTLKGPVLSFNNVKEFLKTLDPDLFEIICLKILESFGMKCERTSLNFPNFDIVARQTVIIGTNNHEELIWGVSCKRWFNKHISLHYLPNVGNIKGINLGGIIIMSTEKITKNAEVTIKGYKGLGFKVDLWTGDRLIEYLRENDEILSEVWTFKLK